MTVPMTHQNMGHDRSILHGHDRAHGPASSSSETRGDLRRRFSTAISPICSSSAKAFHFDRVDMPSLLTIVFDNTIARPPVRQCS